MPAVYTSNKNICTTNKKYNIVQMYQITEEEKHVFHQTRKRRRTEYRYRVTSRNVKSLFLLLRMDNLHRVYLILTLLSYAVPCVNGYKEQRFAIEPQDQVAVVGSRVTLPCRVENKAGQLQWTKDDFGLGLHRHLIGYDRYRMVGSDEEGDYSLDIREVTLEDDAKYQCQVSSGPSGEPPIRSRYARLNVLVSPEPPKILQGSSMEVIEDREQVFECISVGGKPPAEITWVDGEGGVLNQNVIYNVEPMVDGRRFTARSVLRLRPRRYHDYQNLSCQAQNTADRAFKATTIRLEVKYAPTVRLFLKSNIAAGRILEGDKLRLGCEAEGNPSDFTFKWYLNNQMIPGNFINELVITNVTRKYNDVTIKCEVHNSVGKSSDTKILEVSYGPSFVTKPENIEAETGATRTMSCVVDGHPNPEVIWLRYENGRIIKVGQTSNLTITVNDNTAGEYWCRTSVEGFQPIEAEVTVFVKGPPRIISNSTQYGIQGNRIYIECLSFSVPKPDYFVWSFEGQQIKTESEDYESSQESGLEGLTKSTLIIREGKSVNFGRYNCTVHNMYGKDTIEIRLVRYKTLPLILIASIVTACVLSISLTTVLVAVCRRRVKELPDDIKKPDVTDIGKAHCDDKCNSDRSSNISELKLELRQVEGSCEMELSNQSDSEYRIASGLELPLAGLVPLPNSGLDQEYNMTYPRYSMDFGDTKNLHFKVPNQSNGYVQYVDYSKDYIPPVLNSSSRGSLTRSMDTSVPYAEVHHAIHKLRPTNSNQAISALGVQSVGPDVIPTPSGALSTGVDLRYAATYGNPYLKCNGRNTVTAESTAAPPPYYSIRNSTLPQLTTVTPSGASTSRIRGSVVSSQSVAQPQASRCSPQSPNALYVLASTTQNCHNNQILNKCNGSQITNATHV